MREHGMSVSALLNSNAHVVSAPPLASTIAFSVAFVRPIAVAAPVVTDGGSGRSVTL